MLLTVAIPSVMRLADDTDLRPAVRPHVVLRLADHDQPAVRRLRRGLLHRLEHVALWIGSITLGIAIAGGDLMWMLWVTKFAPSPPGRRLHGPAHVLHRDPRRARPACWRSSIVGQLPLVWIAAISAGLMILSSAILVPEARAERRRVRLDRPAPRRRRRVAVNEASPAPRRRSRRSSAGGGTRAGRPSRPSSVVGATKAISRSSRSRAHACQRAASHPRLAEQDHRQLRLHARARRRRSTAAAPTAYSVVAIDGAHASVMASVPCTSNVNQNGRPDGRRVSWNA